MSRIATISIEFEAVLAKARQEYNEFKREVESNPIRSQIVTGGQSAGPSAPGATTFSGTSGVATGGTFVPPPTIGSVGGAAPMGKTFNLSPGEQASVDASILASRFNLASQHAAQKEMINAGVAASRFNLAQQARVDKNFDAYHLAQQRQAEGVSARVDKTWDSVGLAQQRSDERAAQRLETDGDRREMAWAMKSFRSGRAQLDKFDKDHDEALQMNMQYDMQRTPGWTPSSVHGQSPTGGAQVIAGNGYNNLGSPTPPGGENGGSGNYAFGFIRPLAAAYIAYHGLSSLGRRAMDINAEEYQQQRLGTYSSLEEQVNSNYGLASSQQSTFSNYVGGALNWFNEKGGQLWGQRRKKMWADNSDAGELAEARQKMIGWNIGDAKNLESRSTDRSSSLIGSGGFGKEYRGIGVDFANAQEALASERRKSPLSSAFGFDALEKALDRKKLALQADVLTRVGQSVAVDRFTSLALNAESGGRFFDAEQFALQGKQLQERNQAARSVQGLPRSVATMVLNAVTTQQASQTAALGYQQNLQVDMAISRNTFGASAINLAMEGDPVGSSKASINAKYLPMFDNKGNLTGFQGMDKSALGQTEFQSRKTLYEAESASGQINAERHLIGLQNTGSILGFRYERRNFFADQEETRGEFEKATHGMKPGDPEYKALEVIQNRKLDLQFQQEADWHERMGVGQGAEKRALERGLKMDTVGQALEQLTGGYESRLQDLKGPEKIKERRAELQNEKLAVELFQQQYALSFRGEALDTRRFAINNPRDVQDPNEVFKEFGTKLDGVKEAIEKLGSD